MEFVTAVRAMFENCNSTRILAEIKLVGIKLFAVRSSEAESKLKRSQTDALTKAWPNSTEHQCRANRSKSNAFRQQAAFSNINFPVRHIARGFDLGAGQSLTGEKPPVL